MTKSTAPLGRVLMIQGTSSYAGKSTIVAGLCRVFAQAGYRVAPFKAQNMSNNAAVTDDGGEVGRAQAVQAMAARVPVTVDMNPVLLKPQSDRTSQIVLLGRAQRVANAREYYALTSELWPVVTGALDRLRSSYDVVVMEGAGSPAEINLAQYDIVNMRIARHADAPVVIVGDIDRGGVFAALYGTVALLQPEERSLVRGFIINKFRGDPSLLTPGFGMLLDRTGVPTLGVLPYLDLSRLPEEDGPDWTRVRQNDAAAPAGAFVDIVVIRLPRIANLDEFQPLALEPDVRVRFVDAPEDLANADLIVVPGTKSTLADLAWLRERGLDRAIRARRDDGVPVLGICGGFQMLGTRLIDEHGAEFTGDVPGLGLLPVTTEFSSEKVTRRVSARIAGDNALWTSGDGSALDAYEIHMGRTRANASAHHGSAPFVVNARADVHPHETSDGACSDDGFVIGTYLHGLFENAALRRSLVTRLAARNGRSTGGSRELPSIDDALDTLANALREHIDLAAIDEMVGVGRSVEAGISVP
jgi:adenosylcobyric acid synthase